MPILTNVYRVIIISPFLFVLVLFAFCQKCDSSASMISDCKDNPQKNLDRCLAATAFFFESAQKNALSVLAFSYGARAAYKANDWQKAFEYADMVFAERPHDQYLAVVYLDAAIMLDLDQKAIDIASWILSKDSNNVWILLKRAWSHMKVGNVDLARLDVELAESVGIKKYEEIRAAAAIHERLGNVATARALALRALQLNPNDQQTKALLAALETQ